MLLVTLTEGRQYPDVIDNDQVRQQIRATARAMDPSALAGPTSTVRGLE
jgi:hypothetical protein